MIELRWVDWGVTQELEYRFVTPNVDASGALCPPGEMSEWKRVPGVNAREVYPGLFLGADGATDRSPKVRQSPIPENPQ